MSITPDVAVCRVLEIANPRDYLPAGPDARHGECSPDAQDPHPPRECRRMDHMGIDVNPKRLLEKIINSETIRKDNRTSEL
jgi:hypothetical protein